MGARQALVTSAVAAVRRLRRARPSRAALGVLREDGDELRERQRAYRRKQQGDAERGRDAGVRLRVLGMTDDGLMAYSSICFGLRRARA